MIRYNQPFVLATFFVLLLMFFASMVLSYAAGYMIITIDLVRINGVVVLALGCLGLPSLFIGLLIVFNYMKGNEQDQYDY